MCTNLAADGIASAPFEPLHVLHFFGVCLQAIFPVETVYDSFTWDRVNCFCWKNGVVHKRISKRGDVFADDQVCHGGKGEPKQPSKRVYLAQPREYIEISSMIATTLTFHAPLTFNFGLMLLANPGTKGMKPTPKAANARQLIPKL